MRTYRFLGALAVIMVIGLTGWSSAQNKSAPAAKEGHVQAQHYWDCAKACDECARVCDACSNHCLDMVAEGKKEHVGTAKTCQDCATVCSAAATMTARLGPFSDAICTSCAEACKRCGDACAKFKDDAMMARCADECRKCEKACRDMLKHLGADKGAKERR